MVLSTSAMTAPASGGGPDFAMVVDARTIEAVEVGSGARMTTARTGGGTGAGRGAGTVGGLATGGAPLNKRRNSSSQSLLAPGRGGAGLEAGGVVVRRGSAWSAVASPSPGWFRFLSHSAMSEPRAMARKIQ